jgi:hypothetical protein
LTDVYRLSLLVLSGSTNNKGIFSVNILISSWTTTFAPQKSRVGKSWGREKSRSKVFTCCVW